MSWQMIIASVTISGVVIYTAYHTWKDLKSIWREVREEEERKTP